MGKNPFQVRLGEVNEKTPTSTRLYRSTSESSSPEVATKSEKPVTYDFSSKVSSKFKNPSKSNNTAPARGLDKFHVETPAFDENYKEGRIYPRATADIVNNDFNAETDQVGEDVDMCEDIIKNENIVKFNIEHTQSKQLLAFCQGCITNAPDGHYSAVATNIFPGVGYYEMFQLKIVGNDKIRMIIAEIGTMGIGSQKGGENLIIFHGRDQVWNYRQNSDCSYIFFTDDFKILTQSNTHTFKMARATWKAEVASNNWRGDCKFNVYAAKTKQD